MIRECKRCYKDTENPKFCSKKCYDDYRFYRTSKKQHKCHGDCCYKLVFWPRKYCSYCWRESVKKTVDNGKLRCSKCKKYREAEDFNKDKRNTSGYKSYCRECQREYYKKPDEAKPDEAKLAETKPAETNKAELPDLG